MVLRKIGYLEKKTQQSPTSILISKIDCRTNQFENDKADTTKNRKYFFIIFERGRSSHVEHKTSQGF